MSFLYEPKSWVLASDFSYLYTERSTIRDIQLSLASQTAAKPNYTFNRPFSNCSLPS